MRKKFKIGDTVYLVTSVFYLKKGVFPILEVKVVKVITETSREGVTNIKYEVEFGTFDVNQTYDQKDLYKNIDDASGEFNKVMNRDIAKMEKNLKRYKRILSDFEEKNSKPKF